MSTLYRKYRPQNFAEVVGQNHIKMILQHEIETGRIAHAYLFCGPRAVGKTTLARVFAKAINCGNRPEGKFEPCGQCPSCSDISENKSLDIIEIDAASHTGVDNVRENIIASARVSPSRLKYKVFIIDEVHMLSTQAFNALLKTLEEPPENVVFILCTTEIHKVPNTIISRCQRFDFKRIRLSDVVKKLSYITSKENIQIDKQILESVARHSEGHMRDAESLLGQLVSIGGNQITTEEADLVIPRSDIFEVINLISYLGNKDSASGIGLINKLVDEGVDLKVFLTDLIEILRKIMLAKINPALAEKLSLELGEALEIKIVEVSQNLSLEQVVSYIEQFMKTMIEIKGSFIIQLPIELAITKLCSSISAAVVRPVVPSGPSQTAAKTVSQVDSPAPSTSAPVNNGSLSLEQIIEKWNELLVRVKKYNHSLTFVLKVCQPRSFNGAELCLAFKYKFHKDRINDPTIKTMLEKALQETHNAKISVEAIIDENLEVDAALGAGALENSTQEAVKEENAPTEAKSEEKAEDNDNLMDNLLKTFGGKVVG